jgi:SAM-dependent methyltransferase
MIRLRFLAGGLVSFIPGAYKLLSRGSTGGTDSAEYCYEVWMKHLVFLRQNGMREMPEVVAELGPGDSIGTGLAALLSGVQEYKAFDVVEYAALEKNLAIFDRLVELFRERAGKDRPSWPDYEPFLDGRLFPSDILTEDLLERSLAGERLERIRRSITDLDVGGPVSYTVPWNDPAVVKDDSIGLILSHAVLEHVNDLEKTYAAMYRWLKPGGFISHQIGFDSHKLTPEWNGHWGISEPLWRLAVGRRPYFINRMPCSAHFDLLNKSGFEIVYYTDKQREGTAIGRDKLARRWKSLSDEDLYCSDAFFQGRKPGL